MLLPVFTLDYEIHGNGDGCPLALMVEPTDRLLRLFDSYGARLTIMADIAEILRFKQHAADTGRDDHHSQAIERQLRQAIASGHDVQLHIHSSWFQARRENGRWAQDWTEYDFAALPPERMDWMIRRGKAYLEELLQPVAPGYRCDVFRAANWSVCPSADVVAALANNGIRIDTSVFKYGRRDGNVRFDYTTADSALVPWPVAADDICARDPGSPLWEFPIYTEQRRLGAFATPQRVHRAASGRFHRLAKREGTATVAAAAPPAPAHRRGWRKAFDLHAWKADFNQCTGRQLIAAIERAETRFPTSGASLPFVLIGHSKLFNRFNEWSLRPFLEHIRANEARFRFGRFGDFPTPAPRVARPEELTHHA